MNGAPRLREAKTILLIDWPSRNVPDTLAKGGWRVFSQEGPGRYVAYDATAGEVQQRAVPAAPEQADLVYMFRPLDELKEIAELARLVGASQIWLETTPPDDELAGARKTVESAGMSLVTGSIADAARAIAGAPEKKP